MGELHETIYEHDSTRKDSFTVSASERWSISMIKRLKQKYPDDVIITAENADGSTVAHVPLEWMRIVPKRQVSMSEESKAAFAERMKESRNNGTTNV